jgi:hypothetical protein
MSHALSQAMERYGPGHPTAEAMTQILRRHVPHMGPLGTLKRPATLPMTLVFLSTADWRQPWRGSRPLVIAGIATILAFGALYYLEDVR